MSKKEQSLLSLGLLAIITFMVTDPWHLSRTEVSSTTPVEWMILGVAYYFMFKWAFLSIRDWYNEYCESFEEMPKRTFVRNSRSHHSKL